MTEVGEVQVDGLRIAYRRAGAGPALVLLHGAFSDSREWRRQLEGLSDEFTVIAWDAPGFGQSSDPPASFRALDYARCLAGFIHSLRLQRPHLVGLSFGAVLALEFFRDYPTIPRCLVLASAYAGWAGSLPPEVVEQRLERTLRELDVPSMRWVPQFVREIFTESAPPGLIDEAIAIASEFHPAGMRTVAHAFARADLREVLPRIHVPTLLLYGDADQRSPLNVAEDLHARIPASKMVVLPGVGHQCNVEAPERFNAEVRNFIRSL